MVHAVDNTPSLWLDLLPRVSLDSHKYKRGYTVVNGGDVASTGAARLAAYAALRVGAGVVSVACSKEALPVYASSMMAVMTKPVTQLDEFKNLIKSEKVSSLLLGPGNGVNQTTKERVLSALEVGKPTVLDADALTVFEESPSKLFQSLHDQVVLTPHQGEFSRVFGHTPFEEERIDAVIEAAEVSGAVVVLKGKHTVIACPHGKHCVVNKNASPYLATAGSGDVLSGIIAGLLAQAMPVFEAACAAVWIHGEMAKQLGAGLISEDLLTELPDILKKLLDK